MWNCQTSGEIRIGAAASGLGHFSDSELYFLFELMGRRSDSSSTIFCTQYRKDDWIKHMGEGIQAEAIVDRYAYTAFWTETGNTNMRENCANNKI
ncbi:MAG: ATP-binding protein [Lachnospiraceae bacterium]|nr:ATP-binding protein [Lachnospiraceae bacterium]